MPNSKKKPFSRRKFLKLSAGTAAAGAATFYLTQGKPEPPEDDGWNAGEVAHILPTVDHHRFIVKTSFYRKPAASPRLSVNGRYAPGIQTDSEGLFYRFDVTGLQPETEYTLQLKLPDGSALCDDWPLKTFPAPDDHAESFRLLAYTCAGGPELYNFGFFDAFLPIPTRQALFARALSFKPDAVVANGDHVYWDMKSTKYMGNSFMARVVTGLLDSNKPVLGSENEKVLKRAIGTQIADLYGVRFRSTPMFFIQDDHDYGENDEADDKLRTFPPDTFMRDLARTTQHLYYPELFSDPHLPSAYLNSRHGHCENFGSLRFGNVFEGLLYDCRCFMTNKLDESLAATDSTFVPPDIERWLKHRTLTSRARHIAHMPSTPVLWTAGKWGEWYPDVKQPDGSLGTEVAKPYWSSGWLNQHDRLMGAAVSRSDRTPIFISGDLHATGTGRILANQGNDYSDNPVVSVLSGAVGTGHFGWPSKFRGTVPLPSSVLDTEILEKPVEENGFTLLDFTQTEARLSHFKWLPKDGDNKIGQLQPFSELTLPSHSRAST